MIGQEYTITDTAKTYQFDPFIVEPAGCPITYSYLVSPPAADAVITFDAATRTFTFFNDDDVTIAIDYPYGISIKGAAGSATPVITTAIPPILLNIKNPCLDAILVSINTEALTN